MNQIKKVLRPAYHRVLSFLLRGDTVRCNCCGSSFKHMRSFSDGRTGVCWLCESYPRTRAMRMVLERFIANADKPIRMLHIAPESALRDWLRNKEGIEYVAGDKRTAGYGYPDYVIDLEVKSLPFPDDSFDFVLCSHVLEHVIDDRKAMAEFRRVLKPSGSAIIQVPYDADLEKTNEEKPGEGLTPQQREARFGQFDHVRIYGNDYFERMKEAGLPIDLLKMSDQDCTDLALDPCEEIMTVNLSAVS